MSGPGGPFNENRGTLVKKPNHSAPNSSTSKTLREPKNAFGQGSLQQITSRGARACINDIDIGRCVGSPFAHEAPSRCYLLARPADVCQSISIIDQMSNETRFHPPDK